MSDSNCNGCVCQYSTPPWWVTMGFTPPNNNAEQSSPYGPSNGGRINTPNPPSVTIPPPPAMVAPPHGGILPPPQPHNGGGGIADTILNTLMPGIGGLIGKIF